MHTRSFRVGWWVYANCCLGALCLFKARARIPPGLFMGLFLCGAWVWFSFRFATKFFVKNPPAKIDSKFYLFLAKFNQERPKSSQNGPKRAQHGSNKGPNGAKRAQHWPKGRRKWTKKHQKNDARKKVGSRTLPVDVTNTCREPFWSNRSPQGSILKVFLGSIKNVIKNQSRNRYRKNMNNYQQMHWKKERTFI